MQYTYLIRCAPPLIMLYCIAIQAVNIIPQIITSMPSISTALHLCIQNDRLLVLGQSEENGHSFFRLVRLDNQEIIDRSFAYDGICDFLTDDKIAISQIYTDSQEKILAIGWISKNNITHGFITRLTSNGILDKSFGNNGVIIFNKDSGTSFYSIQTHRNKLIIAGATVDNGIPKVIILQFDDNGSLDNSFADNGILEIPYSSPSRLTIDPDGDMYLTGYHTINSQQQLFIAKMHSNGMLDTNFGDNGFSFQSMTLTPQLYNRSILLQPHNNRIVLVNVTTNKNIPFIMMGYDATTGELDTTFGNNGIILANTNRRLLSVCATSDHDERIIIAQSTETESIITRYNCDGSPDYILGNEYFVLPGKIDHPSMVKDCLITSDNSIICAQIVQNKNTKKIRSHLVKINTNQRHTIAINKDNKTISSIDLPIHISGSSTYPHGTVEVIINDAKLQTISTDEHGHWNTRPFIIHDGKHIIYADLIHANTLLAHDVSTLTVVSKKPISYATAYSITPMSLKSPAQFQPFICDYYNGQDDWFYNEAEHYWFSPLDGVYEINWSMHAQTHAPSTIISARIIIDDEELTGSGINHTINTAEPCYISGKAILQYKAYQKIMLEWTAAPYAAHLSTRGNNLINPSATISIVKIS